MKNLRFSQILVVISVLGMCMIAPAFGQSKPDLVKVWDSKIIKFNFSYGLTMNVDGISSGTIFGVAPPIKSLLGTYPESQTMFRSFESKDVIGQSFLWGGTAAFVGGLKTMEALSGESAAP